MSKYTDQSDDNNAICPYCEHSYQVEAEDYDEDEREEECESCGKKYWLNQVFSVYHETQPDCEINGQEHDVERISLRNGRQADFCSVCGKCLKSYGVVK